VSRQAISMSPGTITALAWNAWQCLLLYCFKLLLARPVLLMLCSMVEGCLASW
jgi:hypothetical protein